MDSARARQAVNRWIALCCAGCLATGCATPIDPSFPASIAQGRTVLHKMEDDPQPLPRPLVVVGGMFDPGFSTGWVSSQFRAISQKHDKIIRVNLFGHLSFWGYRREILDQVDRAVPADKNGRRDDVDVIAFSLGGLAARYAAIPQNDGRAPLRIARLFTISTPHRGAALADILPLIAAVQRDLRYRSDRILEIDSAPHDYPIYCYCRLGDRIVGAKNTSPFGEGVWWVYTPWFNLPHQGSTTDPRILADIALRIYGDKPLSRLPVAPLPQ